MGISDISSSVREEDICVNNEKSGFSLIFDNDTVSSHIDRDVVVCAAAFTALQRDNRSSALEITRLAVHHLHKRETVAVDLAIPHLCCLHFFLVVF
ncbi:hypothetical protein JOB18_032293 [Solea senegalensis]|uniref:Uncharacterized protein n=1 Tax=Solea senegalensis TaxID=28829 RepID=A0AAV6RK09_SOLSE|nr:hypothetical protein JOB18_032293 [Solea senegalensis]